MEQNVRIFLIEDNPADVRLIMEMLKDARHIMAEVRKEETLARGIQRIAEDQPDIIMLDLSLPDSSGIETLKKVTSAHPDLPVIIMTGLDDEQFAIQALSKGAQDYIVKGSAGPETLERIIRYGIERKRSETQLKCALNRSEKAKQETLALFHAAKAVLDAPGFEAAAQQIFPVCKQLVNADVCYAMVFSKDGQINPVVFQDAESRDTPEPPDYFIPVHDLQKMAFETGKAVVENDVPNSTWAEQLPKGHMGLNNILFTPLLINDRPAGGLWLANTPGGFAQEDIDLAAAFCDLGTLALKNARDSQALKSNLNFMETLLNTIPNPVFYKNTDGVFLGCNEAFSNTIIGSSKSEIIGKTLFEIQSNFTKEEIFQFYDRDVELIKKGGAQYYEEKIKCADGVYRDFYFNRAPFAGEAGKGGGFVVVMQDLSETRNLENRIQQLMKMESLGTLAGGIAHDFNNILSPIIGFTDMAIDDLPEDSIIRENLIEVSRAAMRAKELVFQILTFSRQTETSFASLRMSTIVKEAMKLIRSILPATIRIQERIDTSEYINANATQIHQVVMNLCTNAYHAMRDTGGVLDIHLNEVEISGSDRQAEDELPPGAYIRLSVSDTGTGIKPQLLEQIFDPYFTTKEKGEGTGLGLAVVHGIVSTHRGRIRVKSKVEKGTEFEVLFPKKTKYKNHTPVGKGKSLQRGSGRILVIDDESQIANMISKVLENLGYTCFKHTRWQIALETFYRNPYSFDLVITDMTMHEGTGDMVATNILKTRPDIPVILCTGFSEMMTWERAKGLGVAAFLLKPMSISELAQAVGDALADAAKNKN